VSAVGDRARVTLILADYAAADAVQKLNILGAGWSITGLNPATSATSPLAVVVMIESPPDQYGDEFSLTLALEDEDGSPVQVPDAAGSLTALRIAQVIRIQEPAVLPQLNAPKGKLWAHSQVVLNFANGIPLSPGRIYRWTLAIDGDVRDEWHVSFFVPGPPSPVVFG
jgi:hypothetical protein